MLLPKQLLLISPVVPSSSGHGTSMRVAATLQALSHDHQVSLLVIDLYRRQRFHNDLTFAKAWCSLASVCAPSAEPYQWPYLTRAFNVIHVCRLATVPFANRYLYAETNVNARRTLDFDDYESLTRLNFARLAASQGDSLRALLEQNTAIHFRHLEQSVLARFDTILLSNENDRRAIAANYGCSHFRPVF
jgi:hypothetical protein